MNRYITARYDLFLKDLETVVNIDSGSRYPAGIHRVAEFFKTRFAALGWNTSLRQFSTPFGPCLEVSNQEPEHESYDLLCIGHLDTVFPKGTSAKWPFSVNGKKAFGPGITDMKAGLVSILHVMETLHDFGIAEKLSLGIALNGDEEIGSPASKEWIQSFACRSKRVFVFEPRRPTGHFVLQRNGVGGFRIHCFGQAAHAGVAPEKGRNAILELAHDILKINTFGRPEIGTTVNVTMVSGGSAGNVIPDYAQAECDVRVVQAEEVERITQLFTQFERHPCVEGVRVQVEGGINRPPMIPSKETLRIWEHLVRIGKKLGIMMEWNATGGGSDGNFTGAMGIPTIDGLGPQGGNIHSFEEYLDVHTIIPTVQLLCQICADWAQENV